LKLKLIILALLVWFYFYGSQVYYWVLYFDPLDPLAPTTEMAAHRSVFAETMELKITTLGTSVTSPLMEDLKNKKRNRR
jgi:hypothetical protein